MFLGLGRVSESPGRSQSPQLLGGGWDVGLGASQSSPGDSDAHQSSSSTGLVLPEHKVAHKQKQLFPFTSVVVGTVLVAYIIVILVISQLSLLWV